MPEALEKIQSIMKEAKQIALLSKRHSEDFKLLAREALKCALAEKKLETFSLPEIPEFQKKWNAALSPQETGIFPRQTSVRIPKNQYKVEELSYEENDDFLSLVLTSFNGELNKDALVFEPILPKTNAAFCFFEPDDAKLLQEFEKELVLPPKENIIFLSSGEKTFAEKIFQIIGAFYSGAPSSRIATLLFASLITETNNFIRPVSQEVLRFGSELLSLGADKEAVRETLARAKTIFSARLLGRALARTHVDGNFDVSWTFLSQKDLEKTGSAGASFPFFRNIIQNLRELIPFRAVSLLFWPDKESIFAAACADDKNDIFPLARRLNAELQSQSFMAGPFNNFSEAELQFKKALTEMNILKI